MMINKRRQGQQMQSHREQFMQDDSGYDQGDSFNDQEEEVQYVNNYQGQRNNTQGQNQQQMEVTRKSRKLKQPKPPRQLEW